MCDRRASDGNITQAVRNRARNQSIRDLFLPNRPAVNRSEDIAICERPIDSGKNRAATEHRKQARSRSRGSPSFPTHDYLNLQRLSPLTESLPMRPAQLGLAKVMKRLHGFQPADLSDKTGCHIPVPSHGVVLHAKHFLRTRLDKKYRRDRAGD